ncbi:MAG: hypothetical protein RLZZ621_898 [Gemmatimonadota bacterium]|jgi:hypothetical protein
MTSAQSPLADANRPVTVPLAFFSSLRGAVQAASGTPSLPIDAVRDAGYAAGLAMYEQFASWLTEQGEAAPGDLSDERFAPLAEAFFHINGWGRIELAQLSDAVVVIDAFDWTEAGIPSGHCLVTTGLFAGFFGCLADAPIAVLEVEGNAVPGHCRFLLGSVDVLDHVWAAMGRGVPYDEAAAAL